MLCLVSGKFLKPHSSAYKKWGLKISFPCLPPEQGDWRANNSEGMITEWENMSSRLRINRGWGVLSSLPPPLWHPTMGKRGGRGREGFCGGGYGSCLGD